MPSRADQLEERFVKLLNKRYPLGPAWTDPTFHCYCDLRPELQSWAAMSFFEQETSNGGLAQVFWNSCPNEKELLLLCERGYRMIGATKQVEAIPAVRALFEKWNTEAVPYMRRAIEGDEKAFGEWCTKYYLNGEHHPDALFFLSKDESPYRIRCQWLEANAAKVEPFIDG